MNTEYESWPDNVKEEATEYRNILQERYWKEKSNKNLYVSIVGPLQTILTGIAGIGDRREQDNMEIGEVAAEMFDEIIIRQDKHLRGKQDTELIEMLSEGIKKVDSKKKVTIIPKESEAIEHAIKNAKEGSLVVICSDVVPDALALVTKFKEQEAKNLYDFTKDDIPNLQS